MNIDPLRCCALTLAALAAAPAVAAKLKQTIAFPQPPDRTFGAKPTALAATASSGLAVSYQSRTPSVCAAAGAGAIPLALGKCTIRASQAGNATWAAAANVDRSFSIARGVQTIDFGSLGARALNATPFAVSATASSGLVVAFASLSAAVCTVSANTVTLVAAGTCTLRASQSGNATYAAAPNVDRSFAVNATSALQYTYDGAGNVIRIQRNRAP